MELPLFPLHVVLFPGASLPLQVFEPRYREMMRAVLDADRRLGVVAIRRGQEVGGPAETYETGSVGEVTQVQRAPDGTMQIVVEGRARFGIEDRHPDDPYPRARVRILDDPEGDGARAALVDARAAVRRYLSVVAQLQGVDMVVPPLNEDPIAASFRIASTLQLDLAQRQSMLETTSAAERLRLAATLARDEAILLEALGPSVGRPGGKVSLN